MTDIKSDFAKWVSEEYKEYGDLWYELMDLAIHFAEQGAYEEYIAYLKEEFNHAFTPFNNLLDKVMAKSIAPNLSGEAREVLGQIIESPKFDGDVVSKCGKSELYMHNLIVRIANNNEFGDNAANMLGWLVWKELQRLKENK